MFSYLNMILFPFYLRRIQHGVRSVSVTSLRCEIAKLRKLSQVAFCGGSSKSKLLNDGFCRRFFFIDHKDKNAGQFIRQKGLYRPFIDHFLHKTMFIDHFRCHILYKLVDILFQVTAMQAAHTIQENIYVFFFSCVD